MELKLQHKTICEGLESEHCWVLSNEFYHLFPEVRLSYWSRFIFSLWLYFLLSLSVLLPFYFNLMVFTDFTASSSALRYCQCCGLHQGKAVISLGLQDFCYQITLFRYFHQHLICSFSALEHRSARRPSTFALNQWRHHCRVLLWLVLHCVLLQFPLIDYNIDRKSVV